jgi:hypothetical protein
MVEFLERPLTEAAAVAAKMAAELAAELRRWQADRGRARFDW